MSVAADRPLSADMARGPFAEAVARAEHEKARVVVMRDGRPVAALVPIEDVAALEAWEDERDSRLAEKALAHWDAEGRPAGVTLEELARELDVDLSADPDAAA